MLSWQQKFGLLKILPMPNVEFEDFVVTKGHRSRSLAQALLALEMYTKTGVKRSQIVAPWHCN